MIRRAGILCALALLAASCGASRRTHGVLGVQATLPPSAIQDDLDRIDWATRRAQSRFGQVSGPEQQQLVSLTRATLSQEADRLAATRLPARLEPKKTDLVIALRAVGEDGTLTGASTVRAAVAELR